MDWKLFQKSLLCCVFDGPCDVPVKYCQGDRKGAPLLYYDARPVHKACIVEAHPCGRPGCQHCSLSNHPQTLIMPCDVPCKIACYLLI